MFETIPAKKGDSILALMTEYRNDPRTDKMDLGIGIYRNNEGETPIMKAVMEAQKILLETEPTKLTRGWSGMWNTPNRCRSFCSAVPKHLTGQQRYTHPVPAEPCAPWPI